jgi:hypothetical protein
LKEPVECLMRRPKRLKQKLKISVGWDFKRF